MTITETRPESGEVAGRAAEETADPAGLYRLLGTSDHKTLGRLYIGFSLMLLAGVFILGALLAIDAVDVEGNPVFGAAIGQASSSYILGTAFFALWPLLLGLATYVVPLQVGSSTIAYPRAAALAMWTWVVTTGVYIASVAFGGAYGGADQEAVALSNVALGALVLALLLGTVCVIVTIISLRPRGMKLNRVPLFSFSFLVAGSLALLTWPVLLANVALAQVAQFGPDVVNETYLSGVRWALDVPAVYILAIPALGIIGEIVPVFARRRQAHYGVMLTGLGLFGAFSFGAWAQPAFNIEVQEQLLFAFMAFLVVVPLLMLLGGWFGETMRRGQLWWRSPLLLALVSILLLSLGVLTGVLRVLNPVDIAPERAFLAQNSLVLTAAATAAVAGLIYWVPKIYGGLFAEWPARVVVVMFLVGGLLYTVPTSISALLENNLSNPTGWQRALDAIVIVGGVVLTVAVAVSVGAVMNAARRKDGYIPANLWRAPTLEWAIGCPPEPGSFAWDLEPVISEAPLVDFYEVEEERS